MKFWNLFLDQSNVMQHIANLQPTTTNYKTLATLDGNTMSAQTQQCNILLTYDSDTRSSSNRLGNPASGGHNVSGCAHITLPE